VIALIALVLGAAGSSTAESLVDGSHLKDGSVSLDKLTPAARAAAQGRRGPRGRRGPQGPQGPSGLQGAAGPPGRGMSTVTIRTFDDTIAPQNKAAAHVNCAQGEFATGGGVLDVSTADFGDGVLQSYPIGNGAFPTGWFVEMINAGTTGEGFRVYAICVK
jgi:hypothetical protein